MRRRKLLAALRTAVVVEPGDFLVVALRSNVSQADAAAMLDAFRSHLPEVKVAIVGDVAALGVVKR